MVLMVDLAPAAAVLDLAALRAWLFLGLLTSSMVIGLAAARRLAQYERIVSRHCAGMWAQWQREDDVEQRAAAFRRAGLCPAGCGPLLGGSCEKCGFR